MHHFLLFSIGRCQRCIALHVYCIIEMIITTLHLQAVPTKIIMLDLSLDSKATYVLCNDNGDN